jgi:hypothetical protein
VGWSLWSSRKSVYAIVINVLDYHYPASLRVSAEAGEAQAEREQADEDQRVVAEPPPE